MENLSIHTSMNGNVAVVTIGGRIDSETSPALDEALTKAVGDHAKLVLDLQGVEYMSSAGIRAIIKAVQALQTAGGELKLASIPETVNSILYTVGLNQKVNTYPTLHEAVASF